MGEARYDGHAEWYDQFATSDLGRRHRTTAIGLLGHGSGALLDVSCGGGSHAGAFGELGWTVTGIDRSADQLRLAQARGVGARLGRAEALPFEDRSFDAAVSMWTHTDVDDFSAQANELARVLRPGAHLPLGLFLQTFVDAGFRLERIEEPGDRAYPYVLALRWRR